MKPVEILSIVVLLIAGSAAGLLAGYFAVDLGLFTIPLLLVWYSSSHVSNATAAHLALASTLIVSAIALAPSIARDHRDGFVAWKDVPLLAGTGIVGGVAAGVLARTLPPETTLRLFGIAAFIAGIQLFGQRRRPKDSGDSVTLVPVKLGSYGLVAGGVTALTGMANKLLLQPLLYGQLHIPLKRSSGTANASSAIIALAAGITVAAAGMGTRDLPAMSIGFFDGFASLPLAIGAALFLHAGRRLGEDHTMKNARLVLGILTLALAFKLLIAP